MMLSGDNWKALMMDKPAETDIFIMLQDAQCKECRRGISQLSKLAALTKVKVAILDCAKSDKLC